MLIWFRCSDSIQSHTLNTIVHYSPPGFLHLMTDYYLEYMTMPMPLEFTAAKVRRWFLEKVLEQADRSEDVQ